MLLVPLRVDQLKFNHTWMYNIINGIIIAPSYLKSENSIAGHTGRDQARQTWPNSGGGVAEGQPRFYEFNLIHAFISDKSPYSGASPGFGRGGARNFFVQIWKFACRKAIDMLHMAKPCALLGGFGGMPPREIFFKMVQFGAFWCIF